MENTKQCLQCGKTFKKPIHASKKVWVKRLYCSMKCFGLTQIGHKPPKSAFKKGYIPWNKGNHIKLNSALNKWNEDGGGLGEKNINWKGDKVGYGGLHAWVRLHKIKPNKCTKCGKIGNSYQIHWSNIDHKYKRNLNDYVALCVPCHKKYDLKNGLVKH